MDPTRLISRLTLRNNGVWRVPVPFMAYVIAEPDAVEHVLRLNAKNYGRSKIVRKVIGSDLGDEGLFAVEDGELHQHLQRIMRPFFARGKMAEMSEMVTSLWEPYLQSMRQCDGPVKSYELFSQFSVDLLMKYMFDKSATAAEIEELSRLAPPVFKQMFIRVALSMTFPPLGVFFTRARKRLDQKVWALVKKPLDPEGEHDDLISQLKLVADPETGKKMTEKQIRDQVFTLLMAGFDSVAVVWAWIMRHLAKHPEVLHELQAEVRAQLNGRPPTWEDVDGLPKLQARVMELVDAHMAFPMYFRGALGQDSLGGKKIRKGTRIIINLDAMHQLLERQKSPHAASLADQSRYISFGHGRRQCIGKFLALVMIVMPLIRTLQEFGTWTIPPAYLGDDADYAMTRPPKHGAPIAFTPVEDTANL